MTTQPAPRWRSKFFAIWTGQQFSLFGSSLVQFALVWWLTEKSGSATVLATASLVGVLPQVFLGPFAGTWVDRLSRRWVMVVADGVIALASAALAVLFLAGWVQVWHVYLVLAVRAVGSAFHWPAMAASTTLMVPERQLARVAGLNQTIQGAMNIVSPPAGALLLSWLPMQGIMGIDVFTAIIAITPLFFIPIPQPSQAEAAKGEPYLAELGAGFRYIWDWKGLLLLLMGASMINFFGNSAFSLMPLLVVDHFGKGALELSWLESAFGAGIVMGGLILSIWGGFRRRILTILVGLTGIGAGLLAMGVLPPSGLYAGMGALFLAGLTIPMANGPLQAIVQSVVRPDIQGRVFSFVSSLAMGMTPVGLAVAGPVADLLGVQAWFAIAGSGILLTTLICVLMPQVMHLEEESTTAGEEAEVPSL